MSCPFTILDSWHVKWSRSNIFGNVKQLRKTLDFIISKRPPKLKILDPPKISSLIENPRYYVQLLVHDCWLWLLECQKKPNKRKKTSQHYYNALSKFYVHIVRFTKYISVNLSRFVIVYIYTCWNFSILNETEIMFSVTYQL